MKKSSVLLRISKLAASVPSTVRTFALPVASGSVIVILPILTPAPMTVFSAMVLAERLKSVGA